LVKLSAAAQAVEGPRFGEKRLLSVMFITKFGLLEMSQTQNRRSP